MKTLVGLFLAIVAIPAVASTVSGPVSGSPFVFGLSDNRYTDLRLSAGQLNQIKRLETAWAQGEVRAMRQRSQGVNVPALSSAERQKRADAVRKILTPEQWKRLDSIHKEMTWPQGFENLKLSATQRQRVATINRQFNTERDLLNAKMRSRSIDDQTVERWSSLEDRRDKALLGVLNPQQKAAFERIQPLEFQNYEEFLEKSLLREFAHLQLSTSQKAQIKTIGKQYGAESWRRNLRANSGPEPTTAEGKAARAKARAENAEIRRQIRQAVMKVLTPAQRAKVSPRKA